VKILEDAFWRGYGAISDGLAAAVFWRNVLRFINVPVWILHDHEPRPFDLEIQHQPPLKARRGCLVPFPAGYPPRPQFRCDVTPINSRTTLSTRRQSSSLGSAWQGCAGNAYCSIRLTKPPRGDSLAGWSDQGHSVANCGPPPSVPRAKTAPLRPEGKAGNYKK